MKTTSTQKNLELSQLETENLLAISNQNLKQLQNIFQHAPAAIAIFSGHLHRFIMANYAYQKQNNRTEKDLLGKTYQEVFPELLGTGAYEILDNVYKTGETFTSSEYPAMIDSKNNGIPEMCYFNFSLEALKNESDEIYGLMVMALDITEQVLSTKKIEESEHRYHEMFMNSPFAFSIMKGKEMKITLANELIKEFWGKGSKVEGKTLLEVLPELKNQPFPAMIDSVYTSGVPVYANEMLAQLNRNGILEDRYFNIVYEPYLEANKTISGVITIAHEVTQQVLARKKIEETEHKYHNIIYTSPYMIAIFKGKDLIIEIANDAILETWGKGKDVIGKSFYDVLPEAVEQGFDKLILNVFETGEPYYAYEKPITLWRNERWELMHYNFIYQVQRNMQGEIEGVAILANEVTPHVLDKLRIIESEARFRILADNLPVSIFIADATLEDNITYVNKYWLDFTNQTFDVATNNGWFSTLHPDDKQLVMNIYEPAFKKREPYTIPNFRLKRHDGEYRWFTFQATPRYLANGEFEGYIGAGFDITEQKLFELELIEQKIKAENAVQAKQQFLSNMSHEIRTPMNAIVGFTNVILKTELNNSQKQYLDAIKVSGDALVVLINDILDLAKVDSGKMTFENVPFDLTECIHKIVKLFELKLKEKKLKFNLILDDSIPNQIIGDPMRLRQIILNLLSNAIKFTDKGSISLDVKVLSHNNNKINIEFKINDTGIGIANEKLEAIFNNFEQAHAETSANYGGTGLGLAIVKKLVEIQGGTIMTNSEIGKGSTFEFKLQFDTNISQQVIPNKSNENDRKCQSATKLKDIKILVAEDVLLNQLLIKIVLGNFNFDVEIADNGKIAIDKIKTNQYDLILMDLHMPEMNGFETTNYIRKEMKSQIPIIALTADVTQSDIDKCMVIGMNDYISKPIDEGLLYEKIVNVLNENQR
jgi:PAS domain S-box-containing protein